MPEPDVNELKKVLVSGVQVYHLVAAMIGTIACIVLPLINVGIQLEHVNIELAKVAPMDVRVRSLEEWRIMRNEANNLSTKQLSQESEVNARQDKIISDLSNQLAINTAILTRVDANLQRLTGVNSR